MIDQTSKVSKAIGTDTLTLAIGNACSSLSWISFSVKLLGRGTEVWQPNNTQIMGAIFRRQVGCCMVIGLKIVALALFKCFWGASPDLPAKLHKVATASTIIEILLFPSPCNGI